MSQYQTAQDAYAHRAVDYDDSWHPDYTARLMRLVPIQPGDHILLLACGTGLEAEIAAPLVGAHGRVVGVDATEEMLDVCRTKQKDNDVLARQFTLIQHDIADLDSCIEIAQSSFDIVLCSNAFLLFDKPSAIISSWKRYLKPGGRLVLDVPHENNIRHGLFMRDIAHQLGNQYETSSDWLKSRRSLSSLLEESGLVVEKTVDLEKKAGKPDVYLDKSQALETFDYITLTQFTEYVGSEEFRNKTWPLFLHAWEEASDADGRLKVSGTHYVYVATKK